MLQPEQRVLKMSMGTPKAGPYLLISGFGFFLALRRESGGPTWNRTKNYPLGRDRYIHLTIGPSRHGKGPARDPFDF